MKKILMLMCVVTLIVACNGESKTREVKTEMYNSLDSMSYALGTNIGMNMELQGFDSVDLDLFLKGIQDHQSQKSLFTAQIAGQLVNDYVGKKEASANQDIIKSNQKWLDEQFATGEYQKTETGLLYKIIEEGNEKKPGLSDVVTVDYEGFLISGTKFDSSIDKGKTSTYPLNGFVIGWQEGLQYIGEGGKIKLILPHTLGYGPRPGPGGAVPAYSVMIFEVSLLEVQPG